VACSVLKKAIAGEGLLAIYRDNRGSEEKA
jgi:hypothetical protein